MDIWRVDTLELFLIFFIPGFISIKVYDLLIPGERRDFSKSVVEAVGFSALNFAAFSWLIILIHSNNFLASYPTWYLLSVFVILFVAPLLWPFVLIRVLLWPPIATLVVHPMQKPWDYIFSKKEQLWIIVHLKDRRKIGGVFGFASSHPAKEQIYLQQVWELDEAGKFIRAIERSNGIIILGDEILAVELFK